MLFIADVNRLFLYHSLFVFVYSIAATMSSNGIGIVKNISSPRDMLLVVFGFGVGLGFVLVFPLLFFLVCAFRPGLCILSEEYDGGKIAVILPAVFIEPLVRWRWSLYS